jgi:hypothetical protein
MPWSAALNYFVIQDPAYQENGRSAVIFHPHWCGFPEHTVVSLTGSVFLIAAPEFLFVRSAI